MRARQQRRVVFRSVDNKQNKRENGMCRNWIGWKSRTFLVAACLGLLAGTKPVLADANPSVCTFSSATAALGTFCDANATIGINGATVVVGQTIYYRANA